MANFKQVNLGYETSEHMINVLLMISCMILDNQRLSAIASGK